MATRAPARAGPERRIDALATLRASGADVWVATASPAGVAHLIPLSYAWDGARVVLAMPPDSVTARNITSSGRARLGFGPTRDVVVVDGQLDGTLDADATAADSVAQLYADQADWDPRQETVDYVFVLLRPERILAWRESNELPGKLLMRDGEWIV
jgi:hypothetical protein